MADQKIDAAKFLALYYEGKNDAEIAQAFGCARQRIHQLRLKHCLAPNGWRSYESKFPERVSAVSDMVLQGLSDTAIAAAMGIHYHQVLYCRRAAGIQSGRSCRMRAWHKKAAELYATGLSDERIARTLGVVLNAVFQWRKYNGLPANHRGRGKVRQGVAV